MTRGEMASETAFILNFNDGQASQDYTAKRIRQALQYTYEREVARAKLEGQVRWFKKMQTFSWASGTVRQELPEGAVQKTLVKLWDATNNTPGVPLVVRESDRETSELFWYDNKTLQWGTSGPSETKTILVGYLADAEKIPPATEFDELVYALIPAEHHWLLVWGAAVFLREIGDESAPSAFYKNLEDCRYDFWRFISKGRPLTDTPTISGTFSYEDSGDVYAVW